MEIRQISTKIAKLKNLPPLPKASSLIVTRVNDPDVDIDDLADAISASPVLVGRLLGLANSAYFGRAGQVNDVRVAIIQVLGLNLVKSLAISIVLNVQLDVTQCGHFNGEKFWVNALLTATLAQKISHLIKDDNVNSSTVYTAGLLLNIGLIAAVYLFPQEMNEILSDDSENALSLQQRMTATIGLDHYQIGAILLKRWQLPEIYQTAIQQYTSPEYQGSTLALIKLLRICSRFSKHLYREREIETILVDEVLNDMGLSGKELESVLDGVLHKLDDLNELAITISGK